MDIRTVDEIDRDLAAYTFRRARILDEVITGMLMLNAIDHRVNVLLEHRHTSAGMAG